MKNTKNTNIKVENDVRQSILKGINKVYKAVSKTMGPHGRTSAIMNDDPNGVPKFTKDGYTVAKAIFESDPFEGIGVGLVKDVVNQTVASSWDGTSISTVLTYNMFAKGFLDIEDTNYNVTEYKRGMVQAGKDITELLRSIKQDKFDQKSIHNIALTSSNGDEELAECISSNYKSFSNKKSFSNIKINPVSFGKTRIEVSSGYRMDTIPLGSLYKTNSDTGRLKSINDRYLVFDTQMVDFNSFLDRLDFLQIPFSDERDTNGILYDTVFIIAPDFGKDFALECIELFKSGVNIVMIKAPFWGEVQIQNIHDFSVMVNSKVQSFDATNAQYNFEIEDIGLSKGSELTDGYIHISTGIDFEGTTNYFSKSLNTFDEWNDKYEERKKTYLDTLDELKLDTDLTKAEVSLVEDRIARIHGIEIDFYIQSLSEIEVIERIDRAQDALHAVISALDEGFIAGGGTTLFKISNFLTDNEKVIKKLNKMAVTDNGELLEGYMNVINSIRAPFLQIISNAGYDYGTDYSEIMESKKYKDLSGINVKTGKMVPNMIKEGIIDPVKVAISAINNSIASVSTALTINSGLHIDNDSSKLNTGFDLRPEEGDEVLTKEQIQEMLDFSQYKLTKDEVNDIAEEVSRRN